MGRETECEILARRLVVPDEQNREAALQVYTYAECSVLRAPSDLPDGEYTASFEDFSFKTTCQRGLWLACGPAVRRPEVSVFDE